MLLKHQPSKAQALRGGSSLLMVYGKESAKA